MGEGDPTQVPLGDRVIALAAKPIVKVIGLVAGLVLFVVVARQAWVGLSAGSGLDLSYPWIFAALLLQVLGETLVGIGLAQVARSYGITMTGEQGIRIHFLTAPARILPGFFGSAVGRVGVGARLGVQPRALVAASVLEPMASGVIAVLLALLFLRETLGELARDVDADMVWGIVVFATIIVVAAVVTLWYGRRNLAAASFRPRSIVLVLAIYLGVWVMFGAALWAVTAAVGAQSPSLMVATAAFAVAWLLGFVVVFVPGGLGIREGVVTFLLTPTMGGQAAASVAVVSRLTWWAATGILFLLGAGLSRIDSKGVQKSR